MSKINIRQVEAFRAVITLGGMTKAAVYLGISQPAVSRLIADFQTTVGFQLFLRGSAEPTPDAMLLFEQVDKLFLGLEELSDGIKAISSMYVGRLTISATSSFEFGVLTDVLAGFKKENPGVLLSYHIQPIEQVIDWVAAGRSHVGFTILSGARAGVMTTVLASREAHCIFPKGHPLEAKERLKPKDLEGLRYVSFQRGSPFRFLVDALFDKAKVTRVLDTEATSHFAVCALVSNDLGVALVSPFAPIDGHAHPLVARPIRPSVRIQLQMLSPRDTPSVVSARFRDYVKLVAPKLLGQAGPTG